MINITDDRDSIQPGDRSLLIIEDDAAFAQILLECARENGWKGVVNQKLKGREVPAAALAKPMTTGGVPRPEWNWHGYDAYNQGRPETSELPVAAHVGADPNRRVVADDGVAAGIHSRTDIHVAAWRDYLFATSGSWSISTASTSPATSRAAALWRRPRPGWRWSGRWTGCASIRGRRSSR